MSAHLGNCAPLGLCSTKLSRTLSSYSVSHALATPCTCKSFKVRPPAPVSLTSSLCGRNPRFHLQHSSHREFANVNTYPHYFQHQQVQISIPVVTLTFVPPFPASNTIVCDSGWCKLSRPAGVWGWWWISSMLSAFTQTLRHDNWPWFPGPHRIAGQGGGGPLSLGHWVLAPYSHMLLSNCQWGFVIQPMSMSKW